MASGLVTRCMLSARSRVRDGKTGGILLSMGGLTLSTVLAGLALSDEARTEGVADSAVVLHRQRTFLPPQWPTTARGPTKDASLPLCNDMKQIYRIEDVIGRGGFGLVHYGREKASNKAVAIKRVDKERTSKDKFIQEVEILRSMGGRHNIVGLREAFETSDAYVLVTELVDGMELFEHLVTKGAFAEDNAKTLVREITQTLAYLHTNRVVHGDLKPENILLSSDSSMRLIDFGQSFRENDILERLRSVGGGIATMAYAAPEVLQMTDSKTAGSAIDMWGLGVILYILLCGYHPFEYDEDTPDEVLRERILHGMFDESSEEWNEASPEARDLIRRLLEVDPEKRITAREVLTHRWLSSVEEKL